MFYCCNLTNMKSQVCCSIGQNVPINTSFTTAPSSISVKVYYYAYIPHEFYEDPIYFNFIKDEVTRVKSTFSNFGIEIVDGICNESNVIYLIDYDKFYSEDIDALHKSEIACNGNSDGISVYFFRGTGGEGHAEIVGKTAVVRTGVPFVAVHEIGHCMGLYHTFEGSNYGKKPIHWRCDDQDGYIGYTETYSTCGGSTFTNFFTIENSNGNNSGASGDFVLDTKGDFGQFPNNCNCLTDKKTCEYKDCEDDCNTEKRKDNNCDYYDPDLENIMSYYTTCWSNFTSGQGTRMRAIVSMYLPEIITSTNNPWNLEVNGKLVINNNSAYTNITINPNSTLRVNNSTIKIIEKIQVLPKALLVGKNSTFTSCNSSWEGIVMHEGNFPNNANIRLVKSIISKANIGINTTSKIDQIFWWNTGPCYDCGGIIVTSDDTKFINNSIGISFKGSANQNHSRIVSSYFIDNSIIGIAMANSKGVFIENTIFNNNGNYGINAGESYFKVTNGSGIHNSPHGISVSGTFPGSSGVELIGSAENINSISNNDYNGFISWGAIHPKKIIINKNQFVFNPSESISLYGNNSAEIANNSILFSAKGLNSYSTGTELNSIICNNFLNQLNNYVLYNNSKTEIIENQYDFQIQFPQIAMYYATINRDQGSPSNPAGNCFSHLSPDIYQFGGSGQNFNYHFYDPNTSVDCQEPLTSGSYTKKRTEFEPSNCNGKIGPFKNIDPDFDGIPDIYTPPGDTIINGDTLIGDPVICWSCINDSINHWVDLWINLDPDGDGEDQDGNDHNNEEFDYTYEMVDEWVNYSLFLAQEYNIYDEAKSILETLPGFRWKSRLVGILFMAQEWTHATQVINSIIPENSDQVNFKAVQTINLARLQSSARYFANQAELNALYNITYSNTPSAGYARSLYYVLTGIELNITFPEVTGFGGPRSRNDEANIPSIYPNPTQNYFTIAFNKKVEKGKIEIYNVHGSKIKGIDVENIDSHRIDLFDQVVGIYVIKLNLDGNFYSFKVSKI